MRCAASPAMQPLSAISPLLRSVMKSSVTAGA
jgi:hypothetical protein